EPTKWGIRMYVLTNSNTGYTHSFLPYYGSSTTESLIQPYLPVTARIILHLYKKLIDLNPDELLKLKCYTTGTIDQNRKYKSLHLKA
ncbi:unnamed protein product, partial [Heterotrigona itama]